MIGPLLTKWTIRLALLCYVACLAHRLLPTQKRRPRAARAIWTLGCVLFVVHVACAFHFYHHWSHEAAWRHTAQRTRELLGFEAGAGIYFSYLFLVLWVFDVAWLWLAPRALEAAKNSSHPGGSPAVPATPSATAVPLAGTGFWGTPGWRILVHVFLLFIAVNGAVIFESGVTRWVGIAAGLALACLAVRHGYNERDAAHQRQVPAKRLTSE